MKDGQGNLYNKVLRKIDNVNQTLGLPLAEFKIGPRDEPTVHSGGPRDGPIPDVRHAPAEPWPASGTVGARSTNGIDAGLGDALGWRA